jgi:hypothetical protein
MASSIRLQDDGTPGVPSDGYARIFIEEIEGRYQLRMIRPDGTVETFGTIATPIARDLGGTGQQRAPQNGELLIGDGNTYQLRTLTAGNNVKITNSAGAIRIDSDLREISIDLAMPQEFAVTGGPITEKGVLRVNKVEQPVNTFYAGPVVGASNVPSFRQIMEQDVPQIPASKIINFVEEVQDAVQLAVQNTADITLEYNDLGNSLKSNLVPTGVVAGLYGDNQTVPSFSVDANGRVTQVTGVPVTITSERIIDFREAVQDVVGGLMQSTDTIEVVYNDETNSSSAHIVRGSIITENISDVETVRSPTSSSIKAYVDTLLDAERQTRASEDQRVYTSLNAHRENFIINAIHLAQGFIELDVPSVVEHSVVAHIGRLGIFEDIDFDLVLGENNKLLVSFKETLLPGGEAELTLGDNFRISYWTRTE